jgi:hypothetical protein
VVGRTLSNVYERREGFEWQVSRVEIHLHVSREVEAKGL